MSVVDGSKLPSWYDDDVLPGAAECFIAVPVVPNDAVFTAVVEASATGGVGTVANVVARPATLVVVMGVVVDSPGLAPLAIPPDVVAWSPIVRDAADGINSVDNPVIFNPAGLFPPS